MTTTHQVTCHTPDNNDADRRIQGLGGPDGGGWYQPLDYLIAGIESGAYKLWTVSPDGKSVWIVVAQRPNGRKYLKTDPDGVEPNNLLALRRCQ
ncbi:DUF3892 domain-containing protein [Mesorhizobium ciceri]|uniref:DUF3892 domain-containing protein n=1 Tax=Mesorhizobium ciceri biovar biserrulae (strain HAMBI 2942 / LMG 23838 / WSM1271) TaxID=765698 RepID=E8T9E9_MESCW|nr:DUF3892 domain-containing protein [Mesorhizobium ciceri]ADV10652.1 hypothetical protein Mesci_1494 [Mesorhizobium ciceri biovar biserrulae WSM1271]